MHGPFGYRLFHKFLKATGAAQEDRRGLAHLARGSVIAGVHALTLVQIALTVIAALLLGFTIFMPWRNWRHYQTQRPSDNPHLLQDTEIDRRPLMAFVAMLLNAHLLLFALASLVPILTLNACGTG